MGLLYTYTHWDTKWYACASAWPTWLWSHVNYISCLWLWERKLGRTLARLNRFRLLSGRRGRGGCGPDATIRWMMMVKSIWIVNFLINGYIFGKGDECQQGNRCLPVALLIGVEQLLYHGVSFVVIAVVVHLLCFFQVNDSSEIKWFNWGTSTQLE